MYERRESRRTEGSETEGKKKVPTYSRNGNNKIWWSGEFEGSRVKAVGAVVGTEG